MTWSFHQSFCKARLHRAICPRAHPAGLGAEVCEHGLEGDAQPVGPAGGLIQQSDDLGGGQQGEASVGRLNSVTV